MKRSAIALFVLLALVAGTFGAGLVDDPIVGDNIYYLTGANHNWKLSGVAQGKTVTLNAKVPGDIITDLELNKIISDPLYNTNWIDDSKIWTDSQWVYNTTFAAPQQAAGSQTYLVFDGIKMGATIILNGRTLGQANDQFLRYSFDVTSILQKGSNTIAVVFPKSYGIATQGRFMACSGGWDWAPYSYTKDSTGATTFTFGIWKDVYLVSSSNVFISAVVPQINYLGAYPTSPLPASAATTGGFNVNVRVVFTTSNKAVAGTLELAGSWPSNPVIRKTITVPAGTNGAEYTAEIAFPAAIKDVMLWWPNGYGDQHLYNLTIKFTPNSGSPLTVTRRVGFKVFALVTADDSNPATLQGKTGSGNFTMKFRVNGINLWSRGGNMIPMEELEGRADAAAFTRLIASAKAGRFNTLRIWGGGIFYYNAFYDACDEAGLLLYHDMMYAQGGHSPAVTATQKAEIIHQVRRLSHHPSIALWDGCNECGGQGLYSSFVVTTVASIDQSRPVWPSCPSNGWVSGVDQLYGKPNGQALNPKSYLHSNDSPFKTHLGEHTLEEHGPYKHGSGWPAVNGDPNIRWFPDNLPPKIADFPTATGPYKEGYYASEFGCVGFSSFLSMENTLPSSDWGLHAKPLYQRNYPCDNLIKVYFGVNQDLSQIGKAAFTKQLYQCLIGQLLELKSDIEVRRSGNTFGTVTWQLNEIWPTGGWGSVEYGTVNYTTGQILGGRWKPLHYMFRQSGFQDIFVTCGANAFCFVKNDSPYKQRVSIDVNLLNLKTGKRFKSVTKEASLDEGAGTTVWFCANTPCNNLPQVLLQAGCDSQGRDCIFELVAKNSSDANKVIMTNMVAITNPGNMTLNDVKISSSVMFEKGSDVAVTLSVSGGVAVYVVLTTPYGGEWSDNVLFLVPGENQTVTYRFFEDEPNRQAFVDSLTIEHVKMYQ